MKRSNVVYVVFSPRVIFGVYESREDALKHFDSLLDVVGDLRLSVECVIPDLPF